MPTQITAKTIGEALNWIDTQPHHIVDTQRDTYTRDGTPGKMGSLMLQGRGQIPKLFIPSNLRLEVYKLIEPNQREFDTRMYALTRKGKQVVKAWRNKVWQDENQPKKES